MTSFCAYKYGHFQLSIWILELQNGICPPEGMWAIFSFWAQKGKQKGFQSRRPSKMGPCTGCPSLCPGIMDAEERRVAERAGSSRVDVAVPLQQSHLSVMWGSACMKS